MGRIKILPSQVANQIAAGEVIERPASVVKELIENALDAGAGRIEITVEGGGRDLVQVKDDGSGMDRQDLELAVEPHATSKISTEEDLAAIRTLGFRGEALASIASVSAFTIISRQRQESTGWELTISFGREKGIRPRGAPAGTLVKVEDLFGLIPARRKFLKSAQTELGHVSQTVRVYAASNPNVHFELISGKRTLFKSKTGLSGRMALWPLVGEKVAHKLLEFKAKGPWFSMKGYVSPPEEARSSSKGFYFYVNKRLVKDRMLWKALSEACRGIFVKGAYPLGAVFIDARPEFVDVNCHPAKQEVRFRDTDTIFRSLYHGVREALEGRSHPFKTASARDLSETSGPSGEQAAGGEGPVPGFAATHQYGMEELVSMEACEPTPALEQHRQFFSSTSPFRLIGQLADTYLLFEGPEGLLMVDQHAAHEALLFKELMEHIDSGEKIVSQQLAFPIVIERKPDEIAMVEKCLPVFEKFGLKLETFGATEIAVHEVPDIIARQPDKARAVSELLDSALEKSSSDPKDLLWDMAARIACRCAVKADDVLHPQEMAELMGDLMEQGVTNCPHGRPVVVSITMDEIKKRFKR